MNRPGLAYVALVARDTAATAHFLGDLLALPRQALRAGTHDVPVFGIGATALAVFEPDDPFLDAPARPGVHHIALSDADPVGAAHLHALATVEPSRTAGLGGVTQVVVDPRTTAGVRTRIVAPLATGVSTGNGVEQIDHIGVASDDNDAAVQMFCGTLGCPLESTQTDLQIRMTIETFTSSKYPAVHHAQTSEVVGGLRDAFITVGDCELELLQDFDPRMAATATRHDTPGDTKGDQSAIARFVAKHGPGLHHIGLRTPDIDPLLARLERAGVRLIDRRGRPGGRASRIGFVHPATFGGGLVVHFVEREELG